MDEASYKPKHYKTPGYSGGIENLDEKTVSFLVEEALYGRVDRIKDPNFYDKYLWSPLIASTRNGHVEAVTYLVFRKANLNHKDYLGCSALHYACAYGRHEIVQILVESGADTRLKDDTGRTPISRAAENGHLNMLKYLHDRGADPFEKDINGHDATHYGNSYEHIYAYFGNLNY